MSNRDLSLALRLYADSARFVSGLAQADSSVRRFGRGVKDEVNAIRGAMNSVRGQLAQLGVTVGVVANQAQSARMDKGLTQIGQTADMSRTEVELLRNELFRMGADTGQSIDGLQQGFNNAVQSGLKFGEALPVIDATNKAVAVTGAAADRLATSLTVASQAYNFDLAKPRMATDLLDKMTVAGRKGNAELENLSDIFARVGVNASRAGFSFDSTLAFIETLSLVERQPERLATLADSTLRLFTNLKYMKEAAQATGVRFFDGKGNRRDPEAVLRDLKAKYDQQKTEKDQAIFLQKAFGEADLDTIKGLATLLGSNKLDKIREFSAEIRNAGGTIERDLPQAINNAVDQTGRLKNVLRKAADHFAQPINDALSNLIRFGLDKKENGGLGLDGKDMIVGGAGLALGTLAAARYGGKGIGALMKRFGGTAAGLAEGKALEAAAGVTPVFVVNWPAQIGGSGFPEIPGASPAATVGKTGAGAALAKAAGRASLAVAPLLAMYGLSEWAGDTSNDQGRVGAINAMSGPLKSLLGLFGFNKDAEHADRLARNRAELNGDNEVRGQITVKVDQDGRVTSVTASSSNPRVPLVANSGQTMMIP